MKRLDDLTLIKRYLEEKIKETDIKRKHTVTGERLKELETELRTYRQLLKTLTRYDYITDRADLVILYQRAKANRKRRIEHPSDDELDKALYRERDRKLRCLRAKLDKVN